MKRCGGLHVVLPLVNIVHRV